MTFRSEVERAAWVSFASAAIASGKDWSPADVGRAADAMLEEMRKRVGFARAIDSVGPRDGGIGG